jgi:hypothetical protein
MWAEVTKLLVCLRFVTFPDSGVPCCGRIGEMNPYATHWVGTAGDAVTDPRHPKSP